MQDTYDKCEASFHHCSTAVKFATKLNVNTRMKTFAAIWINDKSILDKQRFTDKTVIEISKVSFMLIR